MAEKGEIRSSEALMSLHEAKARAELVAADALLPAADIVPWSGAVFAEVALVKGLPGPAEAAHQPALSGADGEAAMKALVALGYDRDSVFSTLSRPVEGDDDAIARRVRLQIEAVGAHVVFALDDVAARDVAAAFDAAPLRVGKVTYAAGRRLVAVPGFEASLSEPRAKRTVWEAMKCAPPEGPVY